MLILPNKQFHDFVQASQKECKYIFCWLGVVSQPFGAEETQQGGRWVFGRGGG